MSNAIASIVYTDVPGFPAGSVVDHVVVTVTSSGASQSQNVPPGTTSVTFENLADGDYTLSVAGVDASGNTLGTPATGSFTLSTGPTTVTLSLPASVTASQA